MTSFTISHFHRDRGVGFVLAADEPRLGNWPVVYMLDDELQIYVGESLNVRSRFVQHMKSSDKQRLTSAHVVIDPTFNKSAALDLESHLVRLLAGDGRYEVLNRNDGIIDADYFDRNQYRRKFEEIFKEFHERGIFTRPVPEIENSDLFKLSPFKALNPDQEDTIESLLEDLLGGLGDEASTQSVIQGDPGTGKTVVGIYLMKLLNDLGAPRSHDDADRGPVFANPFVADHRELLRGFRTALVIPQQALRESIKRVFAKTPGLDQSMVITPFEVGEATETFDLLIVDETHRLNRRANQTSAQKNVLFAEINEKLFGSDDPGLTQLDWIVKQSDHQVFLLDAAQSIRPADLPRGVLDALVGKAELGKRFYPLSSQMRVQSGAGYIEYVRTILSDNPPTPREFPDYELRWFEDLSEMERALNDKEQRGGLSRMLAGYAWKWRSKKDKSAHDIELDGVRRKWNTTDKDWVQSRGAPDEVGSIHTIQGYDLNYAGVIIGNDLRYDPSEKRFYVDIENYFDTKGKENSPKYGVENTTDDLLQFVINIYVVLLTRGIRGTFVCVCDPGLREYLKPFVQSAGPSDR